MNKWDYIVLTSSNNKRLEETIVENSKNYTGKTQVYPR
jgi:hypothetical protein